jgi:hypothetical protein
MLYEKNDDILKDLYKSASFVMQAVCFKQTGEYIRRQKDLIALVSDDEKTIIETFISLKKGGMVDFDSMSETLFAWSKKYISK